MATEESSSRDIGRLEGRVYSVEKRLDGMEERMFNELRSLRTEMATSSREDRAEREKNAMEARAEREKSTKTVLEKVDKVGDSLSIHMAEEQATIKTAIKVISAIAIAVSALVSGAGWVYTNFGPPAAHTISK